MPSREKVPCGLVDLAVFRESLRVPTALAALVAKGAGLRASISPGKTEVAADYGIATVVARRANPYRGEERAYQHSGLPVPQRVKDDIARWETEHLGVC